MVKVAKVEHAKVRRRHWRVAPLVFLAFFACASGGADEEEAGCTTAAVCTRNEDCGEGERCSLQQCVKLFCLADGERCGNDDACASRACVDTMYDDAVISPKDGVCWSGPRKLGWACTPMNPCETGLLCNFGLSGRCVAPRSGAVDSPCTVDEECMAGLICPDRYCQGFSTSLCSMPLGPDERCCANDDCARMACPAGRCL